MHFIQLLSFWPQHVQVDDRPGPYETQALSHFRSASHIASRRVLSSISSLQQAACMHACAAVFRNEAGGVAQSVSLPLLFIAATGPRRARIYPIQHLASTIATGIRRRRRQRETSLPASLLTPASVGHLRQLYSNMCTCMVRGKYKRN